jgi:RNA polymerase sigma-70 factor, ECF subfamily
MDTSATVVRDDETQVLAALRAGDADAFAALLNEHSAAMLRLAATVVRSRAVAEEVVQETWVRALGSLDRFEARSSLKTWLFTILLNTARTRGEREGRTVPFSALVGADDDAPAVDPDRFRPPGEQWAGGWRVFPEPLPEDRLEAKETRDRIRRAIDALPDGQRAVISLRDVEGWTADEVCNVLGLSESNQRVLLHRARSRVRQALEDLLT